ncbi:hypothetical protein HGRIS_009571 [Hohenbuehelia grisea]|uniref:Cellulase n=1 Tax=Hohenbuehelia grisea TaxID=104357 RepID=A0ABR3J1J5_9AGAR
MISALASIVVLAASLVSAQTGQTTRYWDCCKPSCAWSAKAAVSAPVRTCDNNQNVLSSPDTKSGCDGGTAYTCANNQPWAVNDQLSYGFAAVKLSGGTESSWCCACYQLTFTSGPASGKQMIVQATNTGGDLGNNHFDLLMPGGGVGIFNGCTSQYGGWNGGAQYGGVSSRAECNNLPAAVRNGCYWRFDWFQNSDNPNVSFKQVACPSALTSISGCTRNDNGSQPQPTQPSGGGGGSTSTSTTSGTTPTQPGGGGSGTAPKYGQCGGIGWTGPTQCESGSTCTKSNDYYSQCL